MLIKKIIKYLVIPILISLIYFLNPGSFFTTGNETLFIAVLISCFLIEYFIEMAKNGEEIYLRPIAGLKAMEDAVGRATEMGKPVLYVPGISGLDQIDTLAGLTFLGHVSEMTSSYETDLHVPVCTPIVMEAARETCKEAYLKSGHPDLFNDDMVQYIADDQFAYVAGVNGIMQREKPAACFYQGKFYAESLILAETGNSIGAIQIAGTGSPSQIPFFVTACDFTLIGEEFFAASSYMSKKPELIGSIKGQDYIKLFSMGLMVLCLGLSIFRFTEYSNMNSWNETKKEFEYNQIITEWNNLDRYSKNKIAELAYGLDYTVHIKNCLLLPHYQAIDFNATSPFNPESIIDIIEEINTQDELISYFKEYMDVTLEIENIDDKSIHEIGMKYYNESLEMYIFDNIHPFSYEDLFFPDIEFSELSNSSQNYFKQSIDIILFDDLTLNNKIQLINQFNGIKHGYDSSVMNEINKLSDNDKKELLPSSGVDIVDSGNNIFNQVLVVDDFYNLYNYIGEQQSYSFDLSDLFQLKTDPIDKDGQ